MLTHCHRCRLIYKYHILKLRKETNCLMGLKIMCFIIYKKNIIVKKSALLFENNTTKNKFFQRSIVETD